MKVYILSVRYSLTRETEIKGVFYSEEVANIRFKEYQKARTNNKEKLVWEDWSLKEIELDQPIKLSIIDTNPQTKDN